MKEKRVYPLQKAITDSLLESVALLKKAEFLSAKEVADKYYDAINRINDICVNRKRF